jgi:hypothetical protein
MVKLKKKNEINKRIQDKKQIKRMRTKLEDIKKQDYGSNNEIENKLKSDKKVKNQNFKSKHRGPKISSNFELDGKIEKKNEIIKRIKNKKNDDQT